ncbi:DUF397 domain-containing protein [Actinomadura craniellae]|uniref:DUF397 domain-containing protein n=1 Tax=Actinomadura craniellae TaxID=2231787 RepID=A0A365GYM7_9ACTN|nr:DUF397 domain-containing protein [Actinomadura craniellae]RAY11916.1 DUF397 domain-containing protein [Actinomadura craniellae]
MTSQAWRKSSHSTDGTHAQCVEVAQFAGMVGVRDSKRPDDGHLMLSHERFAALIQRIKDNALNL